MTYHGTVCAKRLAWQPGERPGLGELLYHTWCCCFLSLSFSFHPIWRLISVLSNTQDITHIWTTLYALTTGPVFILADTSWQLAIQPLMMASHWRGSGRARGPHGGRGGRVGPVAGPSRTNQTGVCRHFQRGGCSYGARCRYSHDLTHSTATEQMFDPGISRQDEDNEAYEQYLGWRRLIRRPGYGIEAGRPWDDAVEILDSDNRGIHQLIARDLASDEFQGFDLILETVKLEGQPTKSLATASSFLRMITHPSLLDCLSVDSFIGTIFSFFSGANGSRAIKFFMDLCRILAQHPLASFEYGMSPTTTTGQALLVITDTLYELLKREPRSRLHDDLPVLFDTIDELTVKGQDTASSVAARIAALRRMTGNDRDSLVGTGPQDSVVRAKSQVYSTFPASVDMPGGRHDNDSDNIAKIRIIPTYQEIMDDGPECLPTTNFQQPHFITDTASRHIDCAFRLLRHDIFGSPKAILKEVMSNNSLSLRRTEKVDSSAHMYDQANIQHIFIKDRAGLEAILAFQAPKQVRKMSLADQRRWWKDSPRLSEGFMVALVVHCGTEPALIFFEISARATERHWRKKDDSEVPTCLVPDRGPPSISVKLATNSRADLDLLARIHGDRVHGVLVEFHSLIPGTFVPVLQSLQRMAGTGELAFRSWIVPPNDIGSQAQLTVPVFTNPRVPPPPKYARQRGFTFRLSSISRDGHQSLQLDPSTPPTAAQMAEISVHTGLDRGQCRGLLNALSQEYCLIQGPPGTGKSYLGVQLVRVLLDNKANARPGPIILICYTNHALDQFLLHLLEVGITKIIRVGGRSQAQELAGKNLRTVSQTMGKTKVESQILREAYSQQESCLISAGRDLEALHWYRKGATWDYLSTFIHRKSRQIYEQLAIDVEEGFTIVGGDPLTNWLGPRAKAGPPVDQNAADEMSEDLTLRAADDIHQLTRAERWILVESWMREMQAEGPGRLHESLEQARRHRRAIGAVHDDVDRRTLFQADIVGLTTTALARNIETIGRLRPKVIICEEAAEVMEAHILSALMPGVEHFIQIGDHRQLRPQILTYDLSLETSAGRKWQLDRSQFERRAVGEPGFPALPVSQLTVQRRMRPEISRLIRSVYPNLEDHGCVKNLPKVVGMRHDLFWLDHRHPEDASDDGARVRSHSNAWEVDMATAIVRHLIRQGEYKGTDIALLTPYAGQLRKLRASLGKEFEVSLSEQDLEALADFDDEDDDPRAPELPQPFKPSKQKQLEKKALSDTIRLATVDNFQGEEAKVIVVSLVRSNENRKVGFLRTENRINVLLSRAKHGMFLVGNSQTYLHVEMWQDVYDQLTAMSAVGDALELCCPRHPDTPILCSEPDDFLRHSPAGGCSLPCTMRLDPCGHRCTARCHSQAMHDELSCPQPCPRIRTTCPHACSRLCGEICGPCQVLIRDVQLPCGHLTNVACHRTLDLSAVMCNVMVDKTVPGCEHTVRVCCHQDVTIESFHCPTACDQPLPCGHLCRKGSCGKCRKQEDGDAVKYEHPKCSTICDRPRGTCNHRCTKTCHPDEGCGDCMARCEVRCPHSSCALLCSKACAPCIETCTWTCEHQGSCTMPCAAPCNRLPCNERCKKLLECGHQCPSFCGEDCPQHLCHNCGNQKDAQVDFLEFKTFSEIDPSDSPIVLLGCGHFFTGETLDGMVGMQDVYASDAMGNFTGLKDISAQLAASVPSCPTCRRPIRQFATKRYNRVINRAVLDESSKRLLVWGRSELQTLEQNLQKLEAKLEASRSEMRPLSAQQWLSTRYIHVNLLMHRAGNLLSSTGAEHHPTKRLMDAIRTAEREKVSKSGNSLDQEMGRLHINQTHEDGETGRSHWTTTTPDLPRLDSQVTLGAQLVRIKSQEIIIRDKHAVLSLAKSTSSDPGMPDKTALSFLAECRKFITLAKDANFVRYTVQAILAFARVAYIVIWDPPSKPGTGIGQKTAESDAKSSNVTITSVRDLLQEALALCSKLADGEDLRKAIKATMRLSEKVTPEELASIKSAMLSGPNGLATHSGHWYNCVNGHPFSIGECGMPMEVARCPECGERIGGQSHQPLAGVTRAEEIERA